ncbi:MAG TPA: GAF domain-containing sensor histidine kinase [Bryobacteraceae bacterium]|nr:GAF domain-containing sensor histidine kinase [Bryobacteraceae bacterium]
MPEPPHHLELDVQTPQISPELADAADVLSDQLREHLHRLATLLEPHSEKIERRFLRRLRELQFQPKQRTALAAITPGAAALILASGQTPLKFIEQVEYNGRRLAKLNLPPSAILEALEEYDGMLGPMIASLIPDEHSNFQWVREQLHFCVILTLNNAYYQVREAETQAFYELFRVELESRNLEELLRRFLESLVHVCHADAGRLYMLNEDSSCWELRAGTPKAALLSVPNRPGLIKKLSKPRHLNGDASTPGVLLDESWQRRFKSCWSIPLAADGRTAGVMQFGFAKAYEWLPREQDLLAAAAERCLMAAEKARLMEDLARREEQVRRLAEHMLHVEEIERRRISRELHDEAGQSLLCIRLQMELIEQALPESEGEWRSKLREARDLTERTILEMRRLIAALSPAVLEQLGLGAALRQLINRFQRLHPCRVRLQLSKMGALPQQIEIIAYRLVQECFNNVGKHSSATTVNISLASADQKLKLTVEDNGVGFNVTEALAKRESFGLSGMRERVALLGGEFEVESRTEGNKRGTKISIELPISK